jgi:heme A synthase
MHYWPNNTFTLLTGGFVIYDGFIGVWLMKLQLIWFIATTNHITYGIIILAEYKNSLERNINMEF